MSAEYHISRDGKSFGPYVLTDLQTYYRAGDLVDSDLVWAAHLGDWVPLAGLPERVPVDAVSGRATLPPPLPRSHGAAPSQQNAIAMRAAGIKDRIAAEGVAAIPKLVDPKTLVAFAIFFVGSQMGFTSFAVPGMAFPGASFFSHMSGMLTLLYLFACCAFIIPPLVDRKEAWLSYWAPLLLVAIVVFTAWNQYHTITSGYASSLSSMASGNPYLKGLMQQQAANVPSFFSMLKLQAGAYLMFVSAAYLAYAGTARFLAAKGSQRAAA